MAAQVSRHRRFADVSEEDGLMRGIVSTLFPDDLPVLGFEESLAKIIEGGECPDLKKSLKIARKHARRTMQANRSVTEDECAALALYTMESFPREKSVYFVMNAALRANDRNMVHPWRDFIWLLMHAVHKCPTSSAAIVYRSSSAPISAFGKYSKGIEVQWAGFSSVSTSIEVMHHFLGKTGPRTLFNIQLTERAYDIQSFSMFSKEDELLIPPNALFEVMGVLDAGSSLTIVSLKQTKTIDEILDPDLLATKFSTVGMRADESSFTIQELFRAHRAVLSDDSAAVEELVRANPYFLSVAPMLDALHGYFTSHPDGILVTGGGAEFEGTPFIHNGYNTDAVGHVDLLAHAVFHKARRVEALLTRLMKS